MNQHNAAHDTRGELLHSVRSALTAGYLVLLCAALVSCGGKAAAGSSSNAGADAGTCPVSHPSTSVSTSPPASADCTEFVNGMFRKAACDGPLALISPVTSPVSVRLALEFSPATQVPSLTDSPDAELHIADADASWYSVWANQAGNGTLFATTNDGDMTTVRLGAGKLSLAAVPLAGCEARTTTGSVIAPYGDALYLDMQATLSDSAGNVISTITGQAYQPAAHPTTDPDGGSVEADGGPQG